MRLLRLPLLFGFSWLAACSSSPPSASAPLPPPVDAGEQVESEVDAGQFVDAGQAVDAGTPDAGPVVRFVAVGDTGKGNDGQKKVGQAIADFCQLRGCDFVVMLGDNVYNSGVSSPTDSQFQTKFELPYQRVNVPFWVVLGNHDYGGEGSGVEFGKGQHQVDYSALSSKWRMPAKHYRFTERHVEFFALDTNMQMYGRAASQKDAMKSWLENSTAKWKIALGHHPYLSNGPHGNAGDYDGRPFVPVANGKGVKDFMEQVVCGKVDLYLAGHDHSRQYLSESCQGTELMVSGAGASTTALNGKNPTYFQANTLGFIYIRVEDNALIAQFVDSDGNVEFTRTREK